MSDNSWYEKGDLPPVGSKAIVDSEDCRDGYVRSFNGMIVDIVLHMTDNQGDSIAVFSMIDPSDRDCLKFHGMMRNCFKPIKSEREAAVEEIQIIVSQGDNISLKLISERLYDAGYRKTYKR